jgi:NAD(P)-dependent dehydrogenase (short-subunit alcohol dehydrogenase family)
LGCILISYRFGEDDDARAAKLDGMVAGSLVGRPGLPDEVAQGIMFVVENDFVTGTTVDVDGGHLWKY